MFDLTLENFRGFRNTKLRFSRINILIGENSAGKSSVFKFLLALKQSLFSPNEQEFNLTLAGSEVNLGTFSDAVSGHDVSKSIAFTFDFGSKYFTYFLSQVVRISPDSENLSKNKKVSLKTQQNRIAEILGGKIRSRTKIRIEIPKILTKHSEIKATISNSSIGVLKILFDGVPSASSNDVYVIGQINSCTIRFDSARNKKRYIISGVRFYKEGFLSFVHSEELRARISSEYPDETGDVLYWELGFLLMAQNYIHELLDKIVYLNPLNGERTERVYLSKDDGGGRGKVKDIGSLIPKLITKSGGGTFAKDLNRVAAKFGIADRVYVSSEKEGVIRELRVEKGGVDSNILDVGFGVSLQLPIFAQALLSEHTSIIVDGKRLGTRGDTLLIEQPEVHLHPRLQSEFIGTLLDIGPNNNYFIETHSEHLIRALQIIVKKKLYGITHRDISILYLSKRDDNTYISEHSIDPDTGTLSPIFPSGFFNSSYLQALELLD